MSLVHRAVSLSLLTFATLIVHAEPGTEYAGKTIMNGYSLQQFSGFTEKWKLVTVRFRKDTGELRFTYANASAWKALQEGAKDYPDGATFAKIGYATSPDPNFTSSAIPQGSRRFQLMVRNKKKFKVTQGWAYALFDNHGKTFPGEPVAASMACAACHYYVKDRGYVFSEPMALGDPFSEILAGKSRTASVTALTFEKAKRSSLPDRVQKEIPDSFTEVDLITGPISENIFEGTLDEIAPALIARAASSLRPAILASQDGALFSLVFSDDENKDCTAEGANAKAFRAVHNFSDPSKQNYVNWSCYSK